MAYKRCALEYSHILAHCAKPDKSSMNEFLLIPYLIINGIAFALFGIDKQRAMQEEYRISEKTLLTIALFGPFGAYGGMRIFRHKIRKPLFSILVPIFILIHVAIYVLIISAYVSL